jgi:Alpha/beta hydrolase family
LRQQQGKGILELSRLLVTPHGAEVPTGDDHADGDPEDPMPQASDRPIVLIHGLWMTPRSWENWITRYEGRGHRVLAPAYPGFEVEVEALHEDPSPIESITVPETVEHLEKIVGDLDRPPIIIWATPLEVR